MSSMHRLFNAHCNRSWFWFQRELPVAGCSYTDYRAMYMMGGEL